MDELSNVTDELLALASNHHMTCKKKQQQQQQQKQEQQEQQADNEDHAPLATRTRLQQAWDSHGGGNKMKKKNSIMIQPMQLRDLATV
ncbi:hypothetical protein ACA910_017131 [Epithemia clementina (nom. ined.)]